MLFTTFNVGWTSSVSELNERASSGISVAAVLFVSCLDCWGREMQLGAYGSRRDRRESMPVVLSCPKGDKGVDASGFIVSQSHLLFRASPSTWHFPTFLLSRSFMSARLFIHISPVTVGFSSFIHPTPFLRVYVTKYNYSRNRRAISDSALLYEKAS